MSFTLGFARRLTLLRRSVMHEGVIWTNPLLHGSPSDKGEGFSCNGIMKHTIICFEFS
jgi:hypothetical protein